MRIPVLPRVWLCLVLAISMPGSLFAADADPPAASRPASYYWVFLNKGAGRDKLSGMSKEDVAKLQADHLENLGTLHNQGRAFAAGPLGDNGFIRGIVVVTAATPAEVQECFKADPFVQQDILAVEAYRWLVDRAKFHPPAEPFQLAKHTLGIVKKGKRFQPVKGELTRESVLGLVPSLRPMAVSGELAVSGPLLEAGDLLGILLFAADDSAGIQSRLAQDESIKEERVVVELHPQYMGAGVLHKPGGAPPARPADAEK